MDKQEYRLFEDTTRALLARHLTNGAGTYDDSVARGVQADLESLGFYAVMRADGGPTRAQAARLARATGESPVAALTTEPVVAGWLMELVGLPDPGGSVTVGVPAADRVPRLVPEVAGLRLRGELTDVPFARSSSLLLCLVRHGQAERLAVVPLAECTVEPGHNLAGEPRDTVRFDTVLAPTSVAEVPAGFGVEEFAAVNAGLRVQQIAGALDRVATMTISYATTRSQFGRPIASFQAVQHQLAVLASQVAVAAAAADLAASTFDRPPAGTNLYRLAAAKARAGEAAGAVVAIAHQLHGALGVSREYPLHLYTERVLGWRQEYGNELAWHRVLGRHLLEGAAGDPWPRLAAI